MPKKVINNEKRETKNEKLTIKTEVETPAISVVKKKKILYVAGEALPFAATGGLADVIGSLPKEINKNKDYDVRVVIPLYSEIAENYRKTLKFLGSFFTPLSWRNQYCGVFEAEHAGVTYYFIDNEYYFKRAGCYGFYDDGERFAFFSKSVLELLKFLDFYPDVLHCHDWQAALAVIYLKVNYAHDPKYKNIKAVFTIHNIEFQGKYSKDIIEDVFGISKLATGLLEFNGNINLMKGAIECCDCFTTVSKKYAEEIKVSFFAHGLENIINRNQGKLTGITNGIDMEYYNSSKDQTIFKNFSGTDLAGKAECKADLQSLLLLNQRADVPLIAMVTRLTSQKGLDLVKETIEVLLKEDIQFAVIGKGDYYYENYFQHLANIYKGKVAAVIAFNQNLARKIYSAADIFLMPSKTEPCGLSQMVASRYGAVSVVRETGGLFDTIKAYGSGGIGFTFANYNAKDMLYVINEALSLYKDKAKWKALVKRVMAEDFGWGKSAERYVELYKQLTGNKI